ncbi:threonine synthase [Alicyclobacillus curvatus]|jgi:threonine synthase|nr:threonine synthase [Alicyclobacillus curvatus]
MPYSYLSHLECSKCGKVYEANQPWNVCECGGPLLARYDLELAMRHLRPETVARRPGSLWRYHELLPVQKADNIVSLGEGMTPMIPLSTIGDYLGLQSLFLKDEGLTPSGSFKARGAAVGISRARELGIRTIVMPTNGNAGAAWALYAARAGITACIVMPEDATSITQQECAASGADLYLVRGLISDAGQITSDAVKEYGWFDTATLMEPYRLEGKKTMGFEIAEYFAWDAPDVIIYPTGGGVGLIGIYKAMLELRSLGWLEGGRLPRLVAVQASGCAPIVKAYDEDKLVSQFWDNAHTVAYGITVPKPLGDFLVLEAIRETSGCAVSVSDEEILLWQQRLSREEGLFVCPEGAATAAAAAKLVEDGWIRPHERVVLLNTGSGFKYPNTFTVDDIPVLNPGDQLPIRRS